MEAQKEDSNPPEKKEENKQAHSELQIDEPQAA